MITRPTAEQPDELRKWLLAADAGPMPFAALEAKRRQQTVTPDELLAIALHRFRRFSRDPSYTRRKEPKQ